MPAYPNPMSVSYHAPRMPRPLKSILLFGAPGVGKGTQGKFLGQLAGYHHLACGDVFRSLDRSSEHGKQFLAYSTRGELVPDELTIAMWKEHIRARIAASLYQPEHDLLVLDGIPRNEAQAKALASSIDVLRIIHLTLRDQSAMIERMQSRALKENRPDDADENVIRNRLEVYRKETAPVLSCYDASLVSDVEASGTPHEVFERILAELRPIHAANFTPA